MIRNRKCSDRCAHSRRGKVEEYARMSRSVVGMRCVVDLALPVTFTSISKEELKRGVFQWAFRRFRLNQGVAARVSGGCFRSIGLSDLTDLTDKPGASCVWGFCIRGRCDGQFHYRLVQPRAQLVLIADDGQQSTTNFSRFEIRLSQIPTCDHEDRRSFRLVWQR